MYFGTAHARIYLSADFLRINCPTGMSALMRKKLLDDVGGIAAFGQYLAEDFFFAKSFTDRYIRGIYYLTNILSIIWCIAGINSGSVHSLRGRTHALQTSTHSNIELPGIQSFHYSSVKIWYTSNQLLSKRFIDLFFAKRDDFHFFLSIIRLIYSFNWFQCEDMIIWFCYLRCFIVFCEPKHVWR